ncbi:peptidase [Caldinitratiruptor microaerophilus]|uniref:Peptidase n=1 Tax=Caldinitratiruptor microaerophilus TaxID=671077 RepID=A0AA35CK79_9FIRM|nr:peptidase [Caldinitratiruptor microaerophilus]
MGLGSPILFRSVARAVPSRFATLTVPRILYERMVAHCREEWPKEACGIMTGKGGVARRAYALRNVHAQPAIRYQIDPADQHVAMQGVLAGQEELVAIYHSHPTTVAYPSRTDVAMARYPEAAYVIVSMAGQEPEVKAFRITDGEVAELPWRVADLAGEWVDLRWLPERE